MKRFISIGAVVGLLAAAPGLAAQAKHVDYSGVWVLDLAKSSGDGLPAAATWTIVQHGDSIITDRETDTGQGLGPVKSHVVVTTDGRTTSNSVPQGAEMMTTSSTGTWDSTGVMLRTSGNAQGYDFVLTDHWTLGADGKTLVSDRTVTVGDQVVQQNVLTFNRKP